MGSNYQFRKNHCFYFSFLPKSGSNYFFSWKTNFNKKSLLLLVEQIFHLAEISFRNRLLLSVATIAMSCRNKLLMQNLIPANIN